MNAEDSCNSLNRLGDAQQGLQDPLRRRWMQAGVATAAGSMFPLGLFAQGAVSSASLAALPRHALVIGNDRYRDSPLKNPVNDARAIRSELEAVDFTVSMALDASLDTMRQRIVAFGQEIARTKAVGLFYFAGHGIQLSWRNYLLPIDTVIDRLEEAPGKAVDLGMVLEIMGKAGNPANIVILDACRNNPFGRDFRVEQKGLSQVDAPVGTLLAYATAPGNVAIDGEGTNGLYTENLLREIRVPDAKVEDIFKRVRLSVRRSSKGLQIPWESTSLEDDFYFQLPEEMRKVAESARMQRFEAERLARQREDEARRQMEAERETRLRAEAERQRKLREAEEAARTADAEKLKKLKEAQEAARSLEEELRRKEAEQLAALRREEEERHRREEDARARQRAADAERRRKLEAERAAREKDEERRQKLYEAQLAIWEKLQETNELPLIENFLRLYPSGPFSELAQLRLDQLLARQGEKRIEIVNAGANPYTRGTARADTAFKVGDVYRFRVLDLYTKIETRQLNQRVTQITDTEVIYSDGRLVTDLLGNVTREPNGRRILGQQNFPLEYAVGRKWTTRYKVVLPDGSESDNEVDYKVVGKEKITVPAGTFECFRVEGYGGVYGRQVRLRFFSWMAPDKCRRPIVRELFRQRGPNRIIQSDRSELVDFKQG